MYRTLLALLFSGISLLSHADNSYLIQARIRDVKDGTVFFLKQFSTQRIINQRSNLLMSMAGNTT